MAYNSAHTGPEIDAAVQLLGQIQDARDSTSQDLAEVRELAGQVKTDAGQVSSYAETVSIKASQVATNANAVEQARAEVAGATVIAEEAKSAAAASAASAQESQTAASISAQAAAESQLAAGLSEQVSAEHADEATTAAYQAKNDQISAAASAASAAASAQNAEAVVTGGTASIAPGPGLIPLADAQGKINVDWLPSEVARTDAVQEAASVAEQASEAAAEARARTSSFLLPAPEAPTVRDNGASLQFGDRYTNSITGAEYIYKDSGWQDNDSLEAIAQLESRIVEDPAIGATPKAGTNGKISEEWLPSEIARSESVQAVAEAVARLKSSTIRGSDYDIDLTGATSAVAGLNAAWADFRATVNEGWRMAPTSLVLDPGVYLLDDTVDFTGAFGWNLELEAPGVVFLCKTPGKVSVEMLGTRGLTCRGLALYGDPNSLPLAGILLGPSNTDVCGNNEFISLKTNGHWGRTAVWNIGSETTLWQHCYFINQANGADSWSYLGDAFNAWGVTGVFRTVRSTLVWASLTCNDFKSCRFAHHGGKSPLYMDGVFHWTFDLGCYFLTWGTACITIRCRSNSYRNVNLDINGLFESGGVSMYGGLDDCIRIVCENGVSTGIEGFRFNAGQPQSKRALIRIETPEGEPMTSGVVKLTGAQIFGSRTINAGSAAKLFSGSRLMVNGKIDIRDSNLVNLNALQGFQGELFTENYDLVQKPTGSLPFSFIVHDEATNAGRSITFGGVGADVDIVSGSTPQFKVSGTANDVSIDFNAKGNGKLRLNSGVVAALPLEIPSYTLASLPPAASWVRCVIIVSDATGGPAQCRSNGTNWTNLRTLATVV